MAAFNWFQRSYEEPKEPEKEEVAEEKVEEEAPASQEDYLKWAKAAYQNIQERKGSPEDAASSAEEAPVAEAPAEDKAAEAPEQTALDEASIEPETPSVTASAIGEDAETPSEESSESAEDEVPTSEPISEVPIADAPVPAETTPDPAEPEESEEKTSEESAPSDEPAPAEASGSTAQPFWAKAQEEREERLERLKAEAILEPEPEPEPAPPEQKFVPLDIDLDEAFLWSAEVLASQGRRPDDISIEEITWLNKLRQGLDKTRRGLVNQLKSIVGQGPLNDEAVDEIESLLLQADVGVAATDKIIGALQERLKEEVLPPEQAIAYLKSLLRDLLDSPLEGGHNLTFTPEKEQLSIWLMTGVNGAGKTTTIGKLTHIATKSGFKCLIGAADTFRAAAVEQVKVWGERSGVDVIANPGKNTDPAAVVFDAISAANSRGTELLLIDTAGRLQNKKNLMDELSKVRKIIDKKAPEAKVESLLVLDATLGQNGLRQAQVFAEAAQLSGVGFD